jgi:hypothetical protein
METLIYRCPICHGKVLFEDVVDPQQQEPEAVVTDKLYCPHCEMLVEPEVRSESAEPAAVLARDAGTENRGRSREGGSNAGGSQSGDLSDQGASQWRRDPLEGERNSWHDKD